MQGRLVRLPVVVAALAFGLLVPVSPGAAPVSAARPWAAVPVPDSPPTEAAPADPGAAAPGEVEGGRVLICALTGILFGAAVMSGNALAAGGAVVGAIKHGCLW